MYPRLITRPLLAVFTGSFGAMTSFYLLLSVLPQYAASVHAGAMGAGIITGSLMLTTVVAELATPSLTTRFGHRAVFATGLLLLGAPALALLGATSLAQLIAVCLVRGIGVAIVVVLGASLVALEVPPARRSEGLGLYGVVVGVPAVVGLPIGVWLAAHGGYARVFITSGLAALAGLTVVRALPGRRGLHPRRREVTHASAHAAEPVLTLFGAARTTALLAPSALFATTAVAAGAVVTFLPLAITQAHRSSDLAAAALFAQAGAATLARWWAGHRGDRYGAAPLLVPSVIVSAFGLLTLAAADAAAATLVGATLFGAGFGVAQNASLSMLFARVTEREYDTASALWNLAYDAGLGIGAVALGAVAARSGYPAAFALVAAGMLVPALWAGLRAYRRSAFAVAATAVALLISTVPATRAHAQSPTHDPTRNDMTTTPSGHYARINGLSMYYEVHGHPADGAPPLVLLHGGLGTIDAIFGRLLPALAAQRQVIAVELQGHGHTADNGRPMSYEAMADDIAALVASLGSTRVDVVGYSVGGGVTLQLGLRHPDRVRKLVVISAPYATNGWHPEVVAGTYAMDPEAMKGSKWYHAYVKSAPRSQDWPLLVRNVSRLMSSAYDWSNAIATQMKAPVLIIDGDADSVRPSHALALYELLGGGNRDGFAAGRGASQLLIVPNANHLDILDRPALPPAILEYLARDTTSTPPFTTQP